MNGEVQAHEKFAVGLSRNGVARKKKGAT
jgi:hypothetical protein